MSEYKSTKHILANPYELLPNNLDTNFLYPTTECSWDYNKPITIHDVSMWQQLYYVPGLAGVYVAHVPKIEFYMITYNVFIDRDDGIETFYGKHAVNEVIARSNQMGIKLLINTTHIQN